MQISTNENEENLHITPLAGLLSRGHMPPHAEHGEIAYQQRKQNTMKLSTIPVLAVSENSAAVLKYQPVRMVLNCL